MYYIHSESNSVLGYFTTGLENILDFGNQPSQTSLGFNRNTILLLLLLYTVYKNIYKQHGAMANGVRFCLHSETSLGVM